MNILLSIICVIAGVILTRKPTLVWEIQQFLAVKDGEPRERYLRMVRFVGTIAIVFGVVAFRYAVGQ